MAVVLPASFLVCGSTADSSGSVRAELDHRGRFFFGAFAMPTYPTRQRLPAAYSAQVGRIVTRWALLEATLRQVGYVLLQINPKLGRLMIREPRVVDYLTMIEDAMGVMGLSVKTDFKKLREGLQYLERYRDSIAHGVWVKHTGSVDPVLQDTRGTYQDPRTGKQKARINPKAVTIPIVTLRSWVMGIENATTIIRALGHEIETQLRGSPCRCCGQPFPHTPGSRRSGSSSHTAQH